MTDHLQAAKALMADRPDDGDVFAAQTHAMIAIAESLRSGTIERTETVTHYEPFQIPCERCAGSGTDPEARPDAQNRPQAASEPEQAPTVTPEPERPQEWLAAAVMDALVSSSVVHQMFVALADGIDRKEGK